MCMYVCGPCRLRDARDTCALAALSINLRKKRHPAIWSVHQLPSDSSKVMAVPRGGVLVLSQNLLLYYAQVDCCSGLHTSQCSGQSVRGQGHPFMCANRPIDMQEAGSQLLASCTYTILSSVAGCDFAMPVTMCSVCLCYFACQLPESVGCMLWGVLSNLITEWHP